MQTECRNAQPTKAGFTASNAGQNASLSLRGWRFAKHHTALRRA
jgi:hypothetical protein